MYTATLLVAGALMFGSGQVQSGVSGSGMEKVEVMPTVMRMGVTVQAVGDNLDAALENLQKQTDDLSTKLKELKPVEGTLKVEGLKKLGGAMSERERMMAMMRGRFNEETEEEDDADKDKVTVQSMVMADWPLSGNDIPALLKESDTLQEAITNAMPKEEEEEDDAEMDEEDEEAMLMAQYRSMEEYAPPSGTPSFVFVAKSDGAQLAEARRKAYESARKNAEDAAAAAGLKLGSVVHLSASTQAMSSDDYEDYAMRRYYMSVFGSGAYGNNSGSDKEAVSNQLKPLTFTVMVGVQFEFAE